MTEDISTYKFDFEAEVEALQRKLGVHAGELAFALIDRTPDSGFIARKVIAGEGIKGNPLSSGELSKTIAETLKEYENKPKGSSKFVSVFGDFDANFALPVVARLICLRDKEDVTAYSGEENGEISKLFVLYHETGHALTCSHFKREQLGEAAGDAFAALSLLQRFGNDAVPFLSQWSWLRSWRAFDVSDDDHLTTPVVDKLIADSAHCDFSKLDATETITCAKAYAKEWTPAEDMMSAMNVAFQGIRAHKPNLSTLTGLLSTTCLSSEANPLAFYVGTKILQALLHPEGFNFRSYQVKASTAETEAILAGMEQAHASGLSLKDIVGATDAFNGNAARPVAGMTTKQTPLTQLLEVRRAPGQKRVVYNP